MRSYIAIVLMIVGMGRGLYAQDCAPTPFVVGPGSPVTQQMIDMVMDTVRPKVFIGWNWGASLHQVNADLHSNVWHLRSPFSATTRGTDPFVREPYHEMSKTTDGMKLILAPARPYDRTAMLTVCPWYVPLWDSGYKEPKGRIDMTFSGDDPIALTEVLGIRYQPEYTVNTTNFTPMVGDTQGAGFGFQNKVHGTVSGQRFVLQQAGLVGTPTVLSGCWPNTHLVEWSELANTRQSAPFNGRRMYAAINNRTCSHYHTGWHAIMCDIRCDREGECDTPNRHGACNARESCHRYLLRCCNGQTRRHNIVCGHQIAPHTSPWTRTRPRPSGIGSHGISIVSSNGSECHVPAKEIRGSAT